MQPARIEGDLFHNVHLSNITEDETQNPKSIRYEKGESRKWWHIFDIIDIIEIRSSVSMTVIVLC